MAYDLVHRFEYDNSNSDDVMFHVIAVSRVQSIKTASTQDVNGTSTITFNANTIDEGFDITHSSGSANFTINTTGIYEVSFSLNFTLGGRANPQASIYVDGIENTDSRVWCYKTRNTTENLGHLTLPPFDMNLTATDIVTIRTLATGDAGTGNTNLNECWARIVRIT